MREFRVMVVATPKTSTRNFRHRTEDIAPAATSAAAVLSVCLLETRIQVMSPPYEFLNCPELELPV